VEIKRGDVFLRESILPCHVKIATGVGGLSKDSVLHRISFFHLVNVAVALYLWSFAQATIDHSMLRGFHKSFLSWKHSFLSYELVSFDKTLPA